MTLVDPGVLGECDARTQQRAAAERVRATRSLIQ
jgi:hypothetical protein